MRCFELCCGYASFSRVAAEAFGYDAVTVDSDPYFSATYTVDILEWDYAAANPNGHFDVIWASPPCTEYSHARRRGAPRNLAHADAIAQKCLEIIEYHSPRAWFVENPWHGGLLKTRPFMASLPPPVRVHYCQYGMTHKKATCIWTNIPRESWAPRTCPGPGICPAMDSRRHTGTVTGRSEARAVCYGCRVDTREERK